VRADRNVEYSRLREAILSCGYYETLWERWDLYVPFIERGYKSLRTNGIVTFIVSDSFCHSKFAQKVQNWFLRNARILKLDFMGRLSLFDAAIHNMVFFFQNADGKRFRPVRRDHAERFGQSIQLQSDEQRNLDHRAFLPREIAVFEYGARVLPLSLVCYVSFGCRPNSDEKVARGLFVVADLLAFRKSATHPKAYIEAKDTARWTYQQTRWLEWGSQRSPELLTRPTFEELYEVEEKIVAADVSGAVNRAAYDNLQVFHSHTLISFVPWHYLSGVRNRSIQKSARYMDEKLRPDLPVREELESTSKRFNVKYLLAVINSSVARDFLRANRRSNIHLYPNDWKKIPIPDVSAEQQTPIVELVDRILQLKKQNIEANIEGIEAEIDELVRRLFRVNEVSR
jgi:adenine-specific DNA-methyltransferase